VDLKKFSSSETYSLRFDGGSVAYISRCVLHVGGMDAMINQAHDVFSHTSIGLHPTERKYTDGLLVPQPDT